MKVYSPLLCLVALVSGLPQARSQNIEIPACLDDRLTIELFAQEPDVVTVTGLTVDNCGRLFVVESHTHFRPSTYDGPSTDRIRMLVDADGDGHADQVSTFFEGTTYTMNIAAHPNGWMYVATRNLVFRIRDVDGDGIAEMRNDLVRFETTSDYPHNAISGFAIDFSGRVFFGLGENMGEDGVLISSDNRLPVNRGAGGIFSCDADGSHLQRVAVGFWNPFHVCLDTYGRLFTGDNDPGNRPPCRFLYVVDGGDYGYRRRTLEPFISLNGENPGTLPMASSTGESPTGIHAYESDYLPADYRGDVLVASWGEHRIDRYRLERDGAGFRATTQPMIAGGEFFRPAGIAVAPDGSLYIGDWVDRSYELHKKGRIWRVRLREETSSPERVPGINSLDRATREAAARQMISEGEVGVRSLESALRDVEHPRVRSVALAALISSHKITAEGAAFTLQDSEEAIREQAARMLPSELADSEGVASSDPSAAVRAAALRRLEDESAIPLVLEALDTHDPFLFQAASMALRKSSDDSLLLSLLKHTSPRVRLAALLQLRGGAPGDPTASHLDFRSREQALAVALQDPDDLILRTAVEWIGRDEMIGFHARLIEDLPLKASTPELLEAYLAALAQLDGVMKKWTKGSTGDWWIKAVDAYRYLEPLLEKPGLSPDVAVQILRSLPVSHAALTLAKLQSLLDSADQELQIAVVQRLSDLDEDAAQLLLFALAGDVKYAADVRAEAVVGIKLSSAGLDQLLELAVTQNGVVRDEALRSLRGAPLSENQLRRLRTIVVDAGGTSELLQRILNPSQFSLATSTDLDRWESRLAGHGDAKAGRRVFFHPRGPGCSKCHRIDGRGQSVGPNLVRVDGRLALSRRRLIEAIVAPGREVDPGYLPLTIATIDGRIATGIYHKHGKGIREIINSRGEIEAFKIDEIEQMRPSRTSIMPDGLAEQMTEQEFRDLLEFLLVGP